MVTGIIIKSKNINIRRFGKTGGKILAGIFILFLIVLLLLSLPAVQTALAKRLTAYLRRETGADVRIEYLKLSRTGRVEMNHILALDRRKDTVIYIGSVQTDILDFGKLIQGKTLLNTVYLRDSKVIMRKYKGESTDELDYFISLLDTSPPDEQGSHFLLTSDLVRITGTSFRLEDRNLQADPIVSYRNIDGIIKNFTIKGSDVSGKIRNLSFVNERDIRVEEMQTDFAYTNDHMYFHKLLLNTDTSRIQGDLEMHYTKKDLKDFNNKVRIQARLTHSTLSLSDAKKYYPPLGNDDVYFIDGTLSGTLNDQQWKNLSLKSRKGGEFAGDFRLIDAFDKDKPVEIQTNYRQLHTGYEHLRSLLPATFNYSLKDFITRLGNIRSNGTLSIRGDSLISKAHTFTGLGTYDYSVRLGNLFDTPSLTYYGRVKIQDLPLGTLTKDSLPGNLHADLNLSGKGTDWEHLRTSVNGDIHFIQWRNFTYRKIHIDGQLVKQRFKGAIHADDDNLKMQFLGLADFSGDTYSYDFKARIDKMSLSPFHIFTAEQNPVFSGDISVNMHGNTMENLLGRAVVQKAVLQLNGQEHAIRSLQIDSGVKDSIMQLTVHAPGLMQVNLKGNYRYEDLGALSLNALGSIYTHYRPLRVEPHQNIRYKIRLEKQFFDILSPDIHLNGTVRAQGVIDTDTEWFKLKMKTDKIAYSKLILKKLQVQIDNHNPLFNTQISADSILLPSYTLKAFNLVNKTLNDTLFFRTECTGGMHDEDSYNLSFYHTLDSQSNSVLGFDKSAIDIGDSRWWLNPDSDDKNKIVYHPSTHTIKYEDFKLYSKDKGGLLFQGASEGEKQSYNIDLDRIYLENIIPDMEGFDIKGLLNGGIWIEKTGGQLVPTADVQVLDLTVNDELQGDLIGEIRGTGSFKDYNMDFFVEKDDYKTFQTKGLMHIVKDKPVLDVDLIFHHYELGLFNRLAKGVMEKIRGDVSGTVKLKGPLENPDFSGTLYTSDVGVYFPYLNVDYSLENDTPIVLDKRSFNFDRAPLRDSYLNTSGFLSGSITHYFFRKWFLDIDIDTDNLLAINTKEGDNPLFYGTGYLKGTAHISGKTDNINISINGSSMPGTEIIIPLTDVKTVESSHLIHYKMPSVTGPSDTGISRNHLTDERFNGLTMDFNLDLTKDATIEFIIDPETGSTLRGNGTGNIQMYIDTKGLFNMYGEYVVDKGYYIFNYGFFSKYFNVKKGGTIVFSGDPYKAVLDIEAVYKTKANPGVLLSDYPSDRKIDLELRTKISGELFHSTQKFNITAPNAPIDVSSELDFILNEQNTGNMMIQFISLLMTDRFINSKNLINNSLTNVGSGSINSFSSTVSAALMGMLSNPDDAVNFGFQYNQGEISADNIYRQNQWEFSAAARFGKNKKFRFNGEMYVPTGNNYNTNISGVASIEFPLNKSESLMAKIFQRKNDYQYTDEEQGYTRGAGISWQVNFDKLAQLLRPDRSPSNEKNTDSIQQPSGKHVIQK